MMPKISPCRMSRLDQGGLSRAGEADDAEDLALLNVQINVLQGVDGLAAVTEGLAQMLDLNDRLTHSIETPLRFIYNKKVLEADASRTDVQTPWYHLGSHASSRRRPLEVRIHFCAVTGGSRRDLRRSGRPRNSKTMFGRPFRTPLHQPGLSVSYLPAYSSLHRLCNMKLITLQFTQEAAACQQGKRL